MKLAEILSKKFLGKKWTVRGEDLEWLDSSPKPDAAALDAAAAEITAEKAKNPPTKAHLPD